MSKKIYAGNLSFDLTELELADLFTAYGDVLSTKLIQDQFTGRSKGFGFIEMENDEEALAAITGLNGKEVKSRNIKVNEAIDRPRRNNYNRNY